MTAVNKISHEQIIHNSYSKVPFALITSNALSDQAALTKARMNRSEGNFCFVDPTSRTHLRASSPYLFSVRGRGVRGDLRARTTFGVTAATPASSSQPLPSETGKQSCQDPPVIAHHPARPAPLSCPPPAPSPERAGGAAPGSAAPRGARPAPPPSPAGSGARARPPGRPTWRGGAAGRPGAGGSLRAAGCPAPRPRR